jgi:hypothetical protein
VPHVAQGGPEKVRYVLVLERVDAPPPVPLGTDQVVIPQDPELVRHGRLLHAESIGERPDGTRAIHERPQDLDATRGGQGEHGVGHLVGHVGR